MNQITPTNLKSLNVFELYDHYHALEGDLERTKDSKNKELMLAELETCSRLRSEKIDAIYYYMEKNTGAVKRGKEIKAEIDKSIKHHNAKLNSDRALLMELHHRGCADKKNKIKGKDIEFTISQIADKLIVSSTVEEWSDDERAKYAMVKKTRIVTQYTSLDETVLHTDSKEKLDVVANPDALFNAHKNQDVLPKGVTVLPNYAIKSRFLLD